MGEKKEIPYLSLGIEMLASSNEKNDHPEIIYEKSHLIDIASISQNEHSNQRMCPVPYYRFW